MDNLLGEFMGTLVLVAFGVGVNANLKLEKSYAKGGGWVCKALGWGLAVLFGVYTAVALGAPQADLNPAITLAKAFIGKYTMAQFAATTVAQLFGALCGAIIVYLCFLEHWGETAGGKVKIFATSPASGSKLNGFLAEFICTFFFMFCILMVYSVPNGPMPAGFAPYCVGLIYVAIGLSLGGPTGYAMNMARDLGPRIAFSILPIPNKGDGEWGYAWIPCVAPLVGAIAAALVAKAVGVC